MKWRAMALGGIVVAGLGLTAVGDADAEYQGDCGQRGRYASGGGPYNYGGRCREIYDRIAFDRSKINEIRPTGRHKKAMQWYVDDLHDAERDLDRCRYGGAASASYDPYGGDSRDFEYDAADRSFDWKRDWPELLGAVLYPGR